MFENSTDLLDLFLQGDLLSPQLAHVFLVLLVLLVAQPQVIFTHLQLLAPLHWARTKNSSATLSSKLLEMFVGCLTSQQDPSLVGCLTSQQDPSLSQRRICSDYCTRCQTETEVADQTFYLTQPHYTDTRPASPSTEPTLPGAWQGRSTNFYVTGMTQCGKRSTGKAEKEPRSAALEVGALPPRQWGSQLQGNWATATMTLTR